MTATTTQPPHGGPARAHEAAEATVDRVVRARRRRTARLAAVLAVLVALIAGLYLLSLMVGNTFYTPGEIVRVIAGENVQGATFTVGTLRLPRATLALVAGACFGLGGVTFQTMLRNPLASPDIIGISAGASAGAVFAIIALGLSGTQVSAFAIAAGLGVAVLIYLLSYRSGVAGTRLILIGIGIAAMLESVISYLLSRAGQWDLQEAMRWLAGSLNGVSWDQVVPTAIALAILGPLLLSRGGDLLVAQHGDDTAAALGVRVGRMRLTVVIAAVGLIAFATAAVGPIAFVAFLAGPIASRLVGPGVSLLVPAALVGALLVLAGDFVGQNAFDTRFPVGVITGVLGAPYLVYLIICTNRTGGSL